MATRFICIVLALLGLASAQCLPEAPTQCEVANPVACTGTTPDCLPVPPIGGVFTGANDGCCFPTDAVVTTTTTAAATTTRRRTTVNTCFDLLNPITGVSDCPSRASLCRDSNYNTVMSVQCRRTCGYCTSSSSSNSSSSGCADLLNPMTGVSDCPARRALCTNSVYRSLMAVQCRATCGYCSG